MRIAFLTSSLEPGRDGVGDYTRLLSQELARQGLVCCRVALNDRKVTETTRSVQDGVPELRLPAGLPWPQRVALAERFLAEFRPDGVSLQFVNYGFHPKGLPFGLVRVLRPLCAGRRLQIMFHELWIGEAVGSSVPHRLMGAAQKQVVLRLLRQLRPDVVQTSNETYVGILRDCGVGASLLPIFGNIPVADRSGDDWLFPRLRQAGLEISPANRSQCRLYGFFGSLPPIWPPEPLFTLLHEAAVEGGQKVALLSIGRLGAGQARWDALAAEHAGRFVFCDLGTQPGEKVSEYLNSLDAGIATAPLSLIGKSGSVAAMWDHGLPVIVNRDDKHFRLKSAPAPADNPLVHTMDVGLPGKLRAGLARRPAHDRLPEIAAQFLAALERHEDSKVFSA